MAAPTVEPPLVAPPPGIRRRVRQACDSCRRRRRKCNGLQPCSQCNFYQYKCTFNKLSDVLDDTGAPDRVAAEPTLRWSNRAQQQDHVHPHPRAESTSSLLLQTSTSPQGQVAEVGGTHARDRQRIESETLTSFFDARKGRYCGIHSSIVFPQMVRAAVGGSAPVRLHSYAWNVNLRAEPKPPGWSSIRRFITYQEILTYSNVFLEVLNPVVGIFEAEVYRERSRAYWEARSDPSPDFEAVVASVVALGSLFPNEGSVAETQLVEHVKSILEIGCCYAPGRQSVDQAAAWALRTLYLRLTTRPLIGWLASCEGMHVAEAIALHIPQFRDEGDVSNIRLRVLHLIVFLNTMISAEYGRSRVRFNDCPPDYPGLSQPSALSSLAAALADIDPPKYSINRTAALQAIADITVDHDVLGLFKVDIAIHWYRRLIYGRNCSMTASESNLLLDILETGFAQIRRLVVHKHPWWSVVSTPFHSLLVLLVIDSDRSLSLVPEALSCVRSVAQTFGTSLSIEALETAERMTGALKQKKLAHVRTLSEGGSDEVSNDHDVLQLGNMPSSDQFLLDDPVIDWLSMGEDSGNSFVFWPADVGGDNYSGVQ